MMTKKGKKKMIIALMVIILVLIIAAFVVLYLMTDMFKSDKTLFLKYLGKNAENLETVIETFENQEVINNKCEKNTEIKVNYIENLGTTSENTSNAINNLKIAIDSQND